MSSAYPTLTALLAPLGFETPTPIQEKVMPLLAAGESVHALAPTGSGKTLAFLLPLMARLDPTRLGTRLLVLAPTRELGAQIARVAEGVAAALGGRGADTPRLLVRTAFGGERADAQKEELAKGPQVVVATPGRARDLALHGRLRMVGVEALVLDEADVMLDMGFAPQVEDLCAGLRRGVQAALFSATEKKEGYFGRFEDSLLARAHRIDVRPSGDAPVASTTHGILHVGPRVDKRVALADALRALEADSPELDAVIFCETREGVSALAESLREAGLLADGLSGELGQIARASVLRRFKAGALRYLVATNVAARGLDVEGLGLVVNFDLPKTRADYVHRAGRTGRAGREGLVLNVCGRANAEFLRELLRDAGVTLRTWTAPASRVAPADTAHGQETVEAAPVSFRKIHLNRGKSDKLRPGDIVGVLTQRLGLAKEDVGGILVFDHFTHVEIASSRVREVLEKLPLERAKTLTLKVGLAMNG
jgi:ATP-dependent RNA helicase DeaD